MADKDSKSRIISVAEMREADQYTIAHGTPSLVLMQRAAQGVFDAYDGWRGKKTLIICGSGNNAGDGYALAAIMKEQGLNADVCCLYDRFSPDGQYYYERCLEKEVKILPFDEEISFADYDILVDCMLGTGFSGVPREPIASAIQKINEAGAFVISVDINSGMNGDTGEGELMVKSDLTVSVGFLKTGFFKGRAEEMIGKLVNVDIGITLPD